MNPTEKWILLGLHSALGRHWFAGALPAPEVDPTLLLAALKDDLEGVDEYLATVAAWQGEGRHLLSWADAAYPALLRQLPDPPPLLYVQGDVGLLAEPQLAIVGSRQPTPGGLDNARQFAAALAGMGLCITSGLALGIDAAAHEGALQAEGRTLAVAGTGVDRVYPARHRALAHRIVTGGGALISEFPLAAAPLQHQFPRRNRIISGLSLGTLVVEAALSSGSLITAKTALEQGREVFAIPGSIHNPMAKGCHQLLRQGAKLVETASDILEELGALLPLTLSPAASAPLPGLEPDPDHQRLLAAMGFDPVDTDTLIERSGFAVHEVAGMLLTLELNGLVAAVPGGYLRRA